jgi:epsilon-lactone hydrolase
VLKYQRGANSHHQAIYYLREKIRKIAKIPKNIPAFPIEMERVKGLWIEHGKTRKVILYLHGGAYVLGTPLLYANLAYHLSVAGNVSVLLVEYRLAPEHSFPKPIEDALNAYYYLLDKGIKPQDIIIAGDSAGGGLAMATLVSLRNAQQIMPLAYIGISPWFDLGLTGESLHKNKKKDYIAHVLADWILLWRDLYLQGMDPHHPLASPLYADLHSLPPMFIQVGENDVLLDDARRFTEKAKNAGIPVKLEIWEHMPHDWHLLANFLPEGRRAIAKIGEYINTLI